VRYIALAADYDGTLAESGKVRRRTIAALERLAKSGRRLILVTGRELPDLEKVFKQLDLFDRVVAENGALLYRPATKEEVALAEAPPREFVDELRRRKVKNLSVGRSVVATWQPHEQVVLDVIRDLGLELQVTFNKGAVMVLPSGVNKQSGLRVALDELALSPHNVVGIGDAENDHAFLSVCECAVAVANALPAVKKRADVVTSGDHGDGAVDLVEMLLEDDLARATRKLARHDILVGERADTGKGNPAPVAIRPYGTSILVAGPSGSGKSTTTTALVERIAERDYQFCLIDPEGDYEGFAGAVTVGSTRLEPNVDEVLQLLEQPRQNVVVSLLGVKLEDRPAFLSHLLPRLQELRVRTARPHWIVIDEAHHLLPASWQPAPETLPRDLSELLLITVHPDWVAPAVLDQINTVIAVGERPDKTLAGYAAGLKKRGHPALTAEQRRLEPGQIVLWQRGRRRKPVKVTVTPGRLERRRHRRKYAEGEIVEAEHFFFRGPAGRLQLRAQNLVVFSQIADGIDDETWEFHLRRGDYASWFRVVIKDAELADAADRIARDSRLSARTSRAKILDEIERRYTLPA
jgi:HAD superfamily hydrolase (TIGR01484 family)